MAPPIPLPSFLPPFLLPFPWSPIQFYLPSSLPSFFPSHGHLYSSTFLPPFLPSSFLWPPIHPFFLSSLPMAHLYSSTFIPSNHQENIHLIQSITHHYSLFTLSKSSTPCLQPFFVPMWRQHTTYKHMRNITCPQPHLGTHITCPQHTSIWHTSFSWPLAHRSNSMRNW